MWVQKWFSLSGDFHRDPFETNGSARDRDGFTFGGVKGEGFGFERKERRDGFDRKLYYKAVSRAILYFIFERHADWTRTLTALVVMLYNALSLSPASVDNTGKGGHSHASDFSRYKIWAWCNKGWSNFPPPSVVENRSVIIIILGFVRELDFDDPPPIFANVVTVAKS